MIETKHIAELSSNHHAKVVSIDGTKRLDLRTLESGLYTKKGICLTLAQIWCLRDNINTLEIFWNSVDSTLKLHIK